MAVMRLISLAIATFHPSDFEEPSTSFLVFLAFFSNAAIFNLGFLAIAKLFVSHFLRLPHIFYRPTSFAVATASAVACCQSG